jgi:hypothetical protein
MSMVLLSADETITGTGVIQLLPVANYVITDITIILSNFDIPAIGPFSFISSLQSIGTSNISFQQVRLVGSVAATSTAVNSNQVIQRSFASALILPRQASIALDVTLFLNISAAGITFDLSGFTY